MPFTNSNYYLAFTRSALSPLVKAVGGQSDKLTMETFYEKDYRPGYLARKARYQWANLRYSISRILNRTTGGTAATSTLLATGITPLLTQFTA